jgi:hypothetical protein
MYVQLANVRTRVRTCVKCVDPPTKQVVPSAIRNCTENHVYFGRIHGSQLRESANAGQLTPTLSLPPAHHCLNGEVMSIAMSIPGTLVPWYVRTYVRTRVRTWYHGTYVRTYTCTCGDWRLHQQAGPPLPGHPTGIPGVPPRRRLSDPGVL